MQPSERVRRQWLAFEQWIETVPRAAMEKQILETFQDMDAKWKTTPARTRPTKQDHDQAKAAFRRELEDGLVTLAREDWQRRLEEAGLKDEDWGEMTFKETLAVEKLLGGDLDEEGMAIMESVARAEEETSHTTGIPALTNETRATNLSGYSFVSPMSLSIVDDDEGDTFESIFANEILPSSGPESVVDDIFDAPTSVSWGWNRDLASHGIWSANTSQSSRQSSQTGSPERQPLKTISADHPFFPRVAEPLSHFQAESTPTSVHKTRGPRYIGPQLTDSDEVSDEEADFERFKMETRVAKIREFHDEAARADIQLAQDIYNARKTSMGRGEEVHRIAEHERFMVELRRSKEEERKAIVRAERETRREAFKLRQLRSTPMGWGAAETPRDRLAQEVESKLALGTGFFPTEPVVPSADIRRSRRLSQSTISSSKSQHTRDAQPTPELDRLAANVPGLLEALSVVASSTSSTPVSSASSSTTSSQNPTARWIPPPENKPTVPRTKKKDVDPASVNVASSAGQPKQRTQGRKLALDPPSRPISLAVEPQLPFLPSAPAAPTPLFPPPPIISQPVDSEVNASSLKTKAPSPTSKGPSPPKASKGQPSLIPATSKGSSPRAASKNQPPSGPATSKGPSPPLASKTQPPSTLAPSKGPSPVVSNSQPPPAPPTSKGPSPAASKSQPPATLTSKGPSSAASKSQSPPTPAKRQPPPPNPQPPPTSKVTSHPTPSAETPKPTAPAVVPQKKARGAETETPGASSSRTTLDQMPRPFMHKSLGSDASIGAPPPPAAPGRGVWVSSSSAAAAAKKASSVKSATSTSSSSQMDKSTSIPVPRLPVLAETARPRRMSDPMPPSPRSFAFPDNVQDVEQAGDALPGATKKSKGKQGKSKRVTVEEVSDEEDADTLERLPVDYKYIFEPKPSVPSAVFSHIIDFEPTPPPASPSMTIQSDASSRASNALSKESNGPLTGDGKEKHARWTPSAGNGAPTSRSSVVDSVTSPGGPKKGSRTRASSLLQSGTTVGRKGKGKERAMELQVDDELAKYLEGAALDLKRS
ncbi:hypothetical protein C8R45DRAFT_927800 [Mycena sanguinolenta]|nr:hypothetical protein C8R45DRAFT_927800 [Mycena sanguinolenta]